MENKLTKEKFLNDNMIIFKFLSLALDNVVFKDQFKELLKIIKVCNNENEFDNFISKCKKFQLLKEVEGKDTISSKTIYVARNYVIQKVHQEVYGKKTSQYKYSNADAKVSYFKMFYILETLPSRGKLPYNALSLEKIFLESTTFNIGKSRYVQLYQKLKDKNMLNIEGEIMLDDLEYYGVQKLLNLKDKQDDSKKIKAVETLLNDAIYTEKFYGAVEKIQGNKHFWSYNLGKISDNKSYFIFYNPYDCHGFKIAEQINLVKFDTSGGFNNAQIGDYITRIMESVRTNIKEKYNVVNLDIYFSNEEVKDSVFMNCTNQKVGRHGIKNLDSNLTSRIKETARKEYQTKIMNFSQPTIDYEKYTVSYKIYYNSKATDSEKFYTLNLRFKHTNYDEYIYNKEEQEKVRLQKELARKQKEIDKIFNDEEYLHLMKEYLAKKGII